MGRVRKTVLLENPIVTVHRRLWAAQHIIIHHIQVTNLLKLKYHFFSSCSDIHEHHIIPGAGPRVHLRQVVLRDDQRVLLQLLLLRGLVRRHRVPPRPLLLGRRREDCHPGFGLRLYTAR